MVDIANLQELEDYLLARGYIAAGDGHAIHYCKGGVSGTVVFVERGEKTPMIVKQALAQLKTKEVWECDPNRMGIEYDSNRIYHELMPENAPEVYFYDQENYIYGREAVPDDCVMWKANLMDGLLDFEVARKSIETLVTVHNRCAGNPEIAERFADKSIFFGLRIDPYIRFTARKYPAYKDQAAWIEDRMLNSGISLVHGDYSPKNIMVIGRGISVLDYEVAHYGHPAFDLAFFANHFILKSIRFPEYAGAFIDMLRYMLSIYMDNMVYMDKREMEETTVRTLAFLMLARVDGKSPVEYLVGNEAGQQMVRDIALEIMDTNASSFSEVIALIEKHEA